MRHFVAAQRSGRGRYFSPDVRSLEARRRWSAQPLAPPENSRSRHQNRDRGPLALAAMTRLPADFHSQVRDSQPACKDLSGRFIRPSFSYDQYCPANLVTHRRAWRIAIPTMIANGMNVIQRNSATMPSMTLRRCHRIQRVISSSFMCAGHHHRGFL